jgi:ABC-2 type transport system ATP-binding protein
MEIQMEAIKINNLTKKFGNFTAVDNISFSIKSGEIFGFLGPNGAGKTTTLSILSTLISLTSGEAFVNGFNVVNQMDDVRNSIGMMFQDMTLDDELTAHENMDMHGRLYGIERKERLKRIDSLLKLVDLKDRKDSFVKTFSGGMKRRLEIVRGLLHEPKILFLDEPTLGLDPQTRNKLWEYIHKLSKEKGLTIILTTHYMEEADKLSDRIAIIDKGAIIALDTPNNLKKELGGDVITIDTNYSDELASVLEKNDWCQSVTVHNNSITINVHDAGRVIGKVTKLADINNLKIMSINLRSPSLEDVFLHFTGKTIREQESDSKDAMRLAKKVWGRK